MMDNTGILGGGCSAPSIKRHPQRFGCRQLSTGSNDVGYGVYDLFDLGEFIGRPHKYGFKKTINAIKLSKPMALNPWLM